MDTFAQLVRLKVTNHIQWKVDWSDLLLQPLSITVNALAAAGDVLIAGTLCTLLHLSRTGFHR